MCSVCDEVGERYRAAHGGRAERCAPLIADEIARRIGGEPVSGYVGRDGSLRSHWWVAGPDGAVHDPLFPEDAGGPARIEDPRQPGALRAILPLHEHLRVPRQAEEPPRGRKTAAKAALLLALSAAFATLAVVARSLGGHAAAIPAASALLSLLALAEAARTARRKPPARKPNGRGEPC